MKVIQMRVKRAPWKIEHFTDHFELPPASELPEGTVIHLIQKRELYTLPEGTVLYSIFGEPAVVGKTEIDTDSRGGFMAYGFKTDDPKAMLVYETEIQ